MVPASFVVKTKLGVRLLESIGIAVTSVKIGLISSTSVMENVTGISPLVLPTASVAVTVKL